MTTLTKLGYELPGFSSGLSLQELEREIQQHTLSAYCITSAAGDFLAMNHAYAAFYGFLRSEMLGRHATILLSPDQHERFHQAQAAFVANGENAPQNMAWEVKTKEGRMRKITVLSVRVVLAGDEVCVVTLVEPEF
ncbi:MAG: PAS domain S-box protein [Bacteroidetes bacterium]|nr:PAS domain S-box protein [Bacteroidota bacterium]